MECDSISYFMNENTMYYDTSNEIHIISYYRSLKYTKIKQAPKMKEFDLISNIWLVYWKISFVSLFELSELLIEILISLFINKKITTE
jgi:hypothetical protein